MITDDPRSHAKANPDWRARLIVQGADVLTRKELRKITKWLHRQSELLIENDGKLAATYRATLY